MGLRPCPAQPAQPNAACYATAMCALHQLLASTADGRDIVTQTEGVDTVKTRRGGKWRKLTIIAGVGAFILFAAASWAAALAPRVRTPAGNLLKGGRRSGVECGILQACSDTHTNTHTHTQVSSRDYRCRLSKSANMPGQVRMPGIRGAHHLVLPTLRARAVDAGHVGHGAARVNDHRESLCGCAQLELRVKVPSGP